jgi:[acyl-carrier-protein] S-malonyltransferase
VGIAVHPDAPLTAWVFPGQGSQAVGMARDLFDASATTRALFDEASERAGFDVARCCFDGPAEVLQSTENAQPCLLTASVAFAQALAERGATPFMVAGHSLGEYSALVQAGVLGFGDAVWAVRQRGLLMAAAQGGAMAAILGLSDDLVRTACDATPGVVVPANYNAPGQVVISGEQAAVAAAAERATTLGAKRVVPLKVSGAFHSPLMHPAAQAMAANLATLTCAPPAMPVVSNVTALPVTSQHDFGPLLVRQITEPVRWTGVMQTLMAAGVRRIVEVGPGRVLAGLARQFDRSLDIVSVGTVEGMDALTLPNQRS